MSFNRSRSDKTDSSQNRKSGRSAASHLQRSTSGAYGKGGSSAPPPSSSSLSYASSRSFKQSNNVQGGQSRVNLPALSSSDSGTVSATRNVQNGSHLQTPLRGGASDAPVVSGVVKQVDPSGAQRSTRGVPKAPTSQSAPMTSEAAVAPTTSAKDSSKPLSFQFGSISPGFMHGMQIPARTSSAPPNLDEQKRDQARHNSHKIGPPLPTPNPKQQLPRKDASVVDQSNTSEMNEYPVPKIKKESQVSPAPVMGQMQKTSVLPIPVASMPMQYHQPQVSVQYGGPSQQIQSQGVAASSIQMPMPLPLQMGNAPQVQQPLFIQGLQHHPMQPQGIMHQGQSLGFTTHMGPQLPHQLSNLGIGMTAQYNQQGGKFGSARKTTVKITDPKTHEELRLDKRDTVADGGSSGLRSHPNIPPQSQPIASFASSHPISYYTNYNAGFYPAATSLQLANTQIPPNSHPSRFSYPVSQGLQNVSVMNPSTVKPATGSVGEKVVDQPSSISSSAQSGIVQVTIKKPAADSVEKVRDSSLSNSTSIVEKGASLESSSSQGAAHSFGPQKDSEIYTERASQQQKSDGETLASKSLLAAANYSRTVPVDTEQPTSLPAHFEEPEPEPGLINVEGRRGTLGRSNSIKDNQKKLGNKGHILPRNQIGGQSTITPSAPSPALKCSASSNSEVSETVDSDLTTLSGVTNDDLTETTRDLESRISAYTYDVSEHKVENVGVGFTGISSEIFGAEIGSDTLDTVQCAKLDGSSPQEELCGDALEMEEQGLKGIPEVSQQDGNNSKISSASISLNSDCINQRDKESDSTTRISGNEVPSLEATQEGMDKPVTCQTGNERKSDNVYVSVPTNVETYNGDYGLKLDGSLSRPDDVGDKEVFDRKFSASDERCDAVLTSNLYEATSKNEGEIVENAGCGSVSLAISGSNDDKHVELMKSKKKRREALQKADAQGTTSDLYLAYKGPEEKKENASSLFAESTSRSSDLKQAPADDLQVGSVASKKGSINKTEPDDWEDAADISTPKLEPSDKDKKVHGELMQIYKDGSANAVKKYSRDFLLKFSDQFTDLPQGFEITSDTEALMSINVSPLVNRDSFPSPGKVINRSSSGSRMDRRGSGMVDDDRWSKTPGPFGPGRDLRVDIGYMGNTGFRPGQGGNFGVLRNPRAQTPVQYAGGILSGPMQAGGFLGGMQRNSQDADRWQRATNFQQKGLISSPQTPLQTMHKAERKYEVGKVADEEQAKQRQLKAILNKLTPQNFEKLFEQVKAVNIDSAVTLTGVISQIFDKALMEPTFCEMYANFCHHLDGELPDFSENNKKITFKRLLLNKCQEEFERGEREQEEANKVDEEGEIKQTEEEREEKRVKARRRMLGNIRLIGELYKKKMLTERIMHECIKKLLGQYLDPDEENLEALCKLMSTIGEMIDHSKAKELMDAYFDRMAKLSDNMKLSSRVRFMLKDAIDLRKNKWQQRRKVEGPKKIDEVHRDAAQERHQSNRLARSSSINPSARRTPLDFGPRGSNALSSPNAQMGSFRGLPAQSRGYANQDVRSDDRQSFESRTLSVPLPQRHVGDDSITLGPQGGLARGMSIRGPPAISTTPFTDSPPSSGDLRRTATGLNGFSTVAERPTYSPMEDLIPRYGSGRFSVAAAYDQLSAQERNMSHVNRDPRNVDRGFDRSAATSPPSRVQEVSSERECSEARLQDMSLAAIKEFYSARDEKEVAQCIKDMNSPSFHSSMISLWVTDSFERKDMERDLLAELLVSLARSWEGILTPIQLTKGFELVLTTLEDAVNDAPKAAEFLGHIYSNLVLENLVPLREIGRLLCEGGEERGRLVAIGLAGDVFGSTLEVIKAKKGENVLKEIQVGSSWRLEDFRPPDHNKSRMLEKFM